MVFHSMFPIWVIRSIVKKGEIDVPYPDYMITNLTGNAAFATGLNLQFNCMKVFTVQANLGYAMPTN